MTFQLKPFKPFNSKSSVQQYSCWVPHLSLTLFNVSPKKSHTPANKKLYIYSLKMTMKPKHGPAGVFWVPICSTLGEVFSHKKWMSACGCVFLIRIWHQNDLLPKTMDSQQDFFETKFLEPNTLGILAHLLRMVSWNLNTICVEEVIGHPSHHLRILPDSQG